jgi:L-alanine-DL-glutamate epimerase-like enolase superfamily enzyme
MRIAGLEVIILRRPDVIDAGDSSQDLLLVELTTDEGISGLGEADSSPEVVRAVIDAPYSHEVCRGLRGVVVGCDALDREAIWDAMYRASLFYGRGGAAMQAMAAIDLALWDVAGKAAGVPCASLLGGSRRERLRAYSSVLMPDTPAEAATLVAAQRALGFGAVKLGWGGLGRSDALDESLVVAAVEAAAPDVDVLIDVGSHGWGRDFRAMERFARMLAAHGVFWLEEPFPPDDLASYARLRVSGLRIAAGEEECTLTGFERLIDAGVDVVQPDPARAGGLTQCRRIARHAAARGVALAPHAWSSPVVRAAGVHLSFASPNAIIQEYSQHPTPLSACIRSAVVARDGWIQLPTAPGLGVELDRDAAEAFRVA